MRYVIIICLLVGFVGCGQKKGEKPNNDNKTLEMQDKKETVYRYKLICLLNYILMILPLPKNTLRQEKLWETL